MRYERKEEKIMAERRDAYERARSNAGEDRITLKSVELADAVIKARARYKAETGKDLKKDRITTEDLKNPDPNEGTKIKKAYDKAKKNKGQDRVTAEDIKFHLKNMNSGGFVRGQGAAMRGGGCAMKGKKRT
jgi:hypothetical protein